MLHIHTRDEDEDKTPDLMEEEIKQMVTLL